MSITQTIFKLLPYKFQNLAITLVNSNLYRVRHSDKYKNYFGYYKKWDNANNADIKEEEAKRFNSFLRYVKKNSEWYKGKFSEESISSSDLSSIPILEKKEIISNLNKIKTLNEKNGLVSLTGGTTGASMKVIYTKSDMQERFAILDNFRGQHGYKLGKKTAWFSGKNLISENDLNKGICSHYDFINKIRFYSTFNINKKNFDMYWESLNKFKPEFIVGFPSSVYEICEIADSQGLRLDTKVKVFFPTAETVTLQHREVISKVLGCKLVDQYASSEGAPFILECKKGRLHIHPLTGIFEVVDENMQPAMEGELLVTSFTTKGTPLIRYRVGDRIKLAPKDEKCTCGSAFPIVDKIEGRSTDYILSPTHGKVNLGNISNSTKDVAGIIQFQVIQHSIENLEVLVVANDDFVEKEQYKFKQALVGRFGSQLRIDMKMINQIPKEKSGKFRLVKNLIV